MSLNFSYRAEKVLSLLTECIRRGILKEVLSLTYRALEGCLLKYFFQFLTRKMSSNGIGAEKDDWGEVWNGELLL